MSKKTGGALPGGKSVLTGDIGQATDRPNLGQATVVDVVVEQNERNFKEQDASEDPKGESRRDKSDLDRGWHEWRGFGTPQYSGWLGQRRVSVAVRKGGQLTNS